ncbi:MAG: HEPN domain-containing protein, partial [Gemmatimonadaceae bacterium]
FGSRARGDHHDDSDYDVMFVVDPHGADRAATEKRVHAAFEPRDWMMDVIVSLAPDFLWRRTDVGTLEYMAEREGRVLYSRPGFDTTPRVRERPDDEPRSLPEWIERARSDFRAMDALLRAGDRLEDPICFHAHQAAEKVLKAVLVRAGISPPYKHLLSLLLSLCPEQLRALGGVADACATLDRVFPKTRYPENPIPTAAEVDEAAQAARKIREAARIPGVIV